MSTLAEKIAVMQAALDGKEIEYNESGTWLLSGHTSWNWAAKDYRVKPPAKRQIKMLAYFNGTSLTWYTDGFAMSSSLARVPAEDKIIEVDA